MKGGEIRISEPILIDPNLFIKKGGLYAFKNDEKG